MKLQKNVPMAMSDIVWAQFSHCWPPHPPHAYKTEIETKTLVSSRDKWNKYT